LKGYSDNKILDLCRNPETCHYGFSLLVRKYQKKVYTQIRRLVIVHDDADDLVLDISKGQLAGLLGTIPETLSRILTRMIKAGYVQEDARHIIHISDRKGLQELAEGTRRLS